MKLYVKCILSTYVLSLFLVNIDPLLKALCFSYCWIICNLLYIYTGRILERLTQTLLTTQYSSLQWPTMMANTVMNLQQGNLGPGSCARVSDHAARPVMTLGPYTSGHHPVTYHGSHRLQTAPACSSPECPCSRPCGQPGLCHTSLAHTC